MTHDPMCPTQTMCKCKDQECWDCRDVVLCQCDLIAKVRADALSTAIDAANGQRSKFKAQDWNDAVDAVVKALRGES